MTATPGDVAVIASLVAEELSSPDGSAPLVFSVTNGDLSDPAVITTLQAGLAALAAKAPPVGA